MLSSCHEDKNIISVGSVISFTGSARTYGIDAQKGIELAINEINAADRTRHFSVSYGDDCTQPNKALFALNSILSDNQIHVVIAAVGSSSFLNMCPVAEKRKIVLFSICASSSLITRAGDYIFRNWISDDLEGIAMARYIFKKGKRTAAVFQVNDDYGKCLAGAFSKEFLHEGGKITFQDTFHESTRDFKSQLWKIDGSGAEAIYMVGYAKELSVVLKQAGSLNMKIPFFSSNAIENQEVIDRAGVNAENVIYSTTETQKATEDTLFSNFQTRFKSAFETEPGVFAMHAYDAMNMLAMAIKKAGNNADKIRDYLYSVQGYKGVSGPISFDENGDVIKPVSFKSVRNGKFVFLNNP